MADLAQISQRLIGGDIQGIQELTAEALTAGVPAQDILNRGLLPGMNVVGEYWLQTPDPTVIIIFNADDIAPIMAATSEWDDFFNISVVPAITSEDGLKLAQQMMQG